MIPLQSIRVILYKYDGTSLTEIENPQDTSFYNVQLTPQENKVYVSYVNTTNYDFILYKYNFEELISVSSDYQYDGYNYFATFDGKDIFSMGRNDGSNIIDIVAYDGTSLTPIPGGPENFRPKNFAGIKNNKMYIVYVDDWLNPTETVMVEYAQGASSLVLVPGMPQDKTFFKFVSQLGDKLFYEFRLSGGSYYFSLYAFDGLTFNEIQVPEYEYSVYEFTLNEKLYASCYQGTELYKLFSLDPQNLQVEEIISENPITVFPNPVDDILHIKFNNDEGCQYIDISLYSIEGKLIDHQYYNQNELIQEISYSTNHISSGVYFFNFKTNSGSFRKKIIKL